MNGIIVQYKGYFAFAKYYPDDHYYHGTLDGLPIHASFGGETPDDATSDFKNMIDDYAAYCDAAGESMQPQTDYSISFDMREFSSFSVRPVALQLASA